ncbi:pseudaminic acid synthase [Sulfurospirillum sp. T05]|uniref:Pseudaminic acid synthase n=1 Tax=Sulfurospirillum tamanense TaxID=2813362 RepID=A0ABS2WSX0_9BACT|nr:pseudaminic acid synthase [Sulfurospirillum tamanensis]MBN2964478.1 pseudaminic acid synthase [Sulfurospirillum tamanensis]
MRIGTFDFATQKTFIIAELSANHNGSLDLAIQTIRAAARAGADAIKLQTYTADTITLDADTPDFRIDGGTLWDGQSLHALYQKAYTPWEWHAKLFAAAKEAGLLCFSSPFDSSAVEFLEQFDPPAYKIASFEATDHALIELCLRTGKPLILSTGIATEEELDEVVALARKTGNEQLIFLHCVSAYPAPLERANLTTLAKIPERFGVLAGFSDHTLGITAPVAAVALGARVIEKHFILDGTIPSPDHAFSLDEHAFGAMVASVRQCEALLGKPSFAMDAYKEKNRRFARSLYVSAPIKAGERLTTANIKSVRPGYGLHPRHLPQVLGKKAARDLQKGERLRLEDLHV